MGTRVDFYVGRGEAAEWLGSYPFDGYPDGVFEGAAEMFAQPLPTEDEWRRWVARFLAVGGPKSTTPDLGWPWPWIDSRTTDYAYAWEDGAIYGSNFGHQWFRVDPEDEDYGQPEDDEPKSVVFPDMTRHRPDGPATLGPRSGLIVIGIPRDGA